MGSNLIRNAQAPCWWAEAYCEEGQFKVPYNNGRVRTDADLRNDKRGWEAAGVFADMLEREQWRERLIRIPERRYEHADALIAAYFGYVNDGYEPRGKKVTMWRTDRPVVDAIGMRFPQPTTLTVARGLWLHQMESQGRLDTEWVWVPFHLRYGESQRAYLLRAGDAAMRTSLEAEYYPLHLLPEGSAIEEVTASNASIRALPFDDSPLNATLDRGERVVRAPYKAAMNGWVQVFDHLGYVNLACIG